MAQLEHSLCHFQSGHICRTWFWTLRWVLGDLRRFQARDLEDEHTQGNHPISRDDFSFLHLLPTSLEEIWGKESGYRPKWAAAPPNHGLNFTSLATWLSVSCHCPKKESCSWQHCREGGDNYKELRVWLPFIQTSPQVRKSNLSYHGGAAEANIQRPWLRTPGLESTCMYTGVTAQFSSISRRAATSACRPVQAWPNVGVTGEGRQSKERLEKSEKRKASRTVEQPWGVKMPQSWSPKHAKGRKQLCAYN